MASGLQAEWPWDATGAFMERLFPAGQGFFGTIYRISPDGTEFAVIYSFVSGQILWPACTLVQGSDEMRIGMGARRD